MNTNKFKPNAPVLYQRFPKALSRTRNGTIVKFSDGSHYLRGDITRRWDAEAGAIVPRVRVSKKQRLRARWKGIPRVPHAVRKIFFPNGEPTLAAGE